MILNLVSSTPLSTRGNCTVSSVGPVPPITICRVNTSSILVILEVPHDAQMLTSLLALPIQLKSVALNWAPGSPSSVSNGTPRPTVPNTVAWRHVRHPVGEPQAARAFHILRHHRGIARNVLAEMPGEHAGVEIVTTADAIADIKLDGLALVEIGRALGTGGKSRHEQRQDGNHCAADGS